MLHNIRLIERRFPKLAGRLVPSLLALSASALVVGLGLLLLRR